MTAMAGRTGTEWLCFDSAAPLDISIPLRFDGEQPNHFGAARASAVPMRSGTFVGDTRRGGSCNATDVRLNPHCNGTHTECVGHVTEERVFVTELVRDVLCSAHVVTVVPQRVNDNGAVERIIDATDLAEAAAGMAEHTRALVVRTLPNPSDKQQRKYGDSADSAWYTADAARWMVEKGIRHWLTDTPSVDRLHDGGKLSAHRVFWGLPPGSRRLADAGRPYATITEMIYVDDAITDGGYVLNLQIPPFMLDAAPSRPLLYPLHEGRQPASTDEPQR